MQSKNVYLPPGFKWMLLFQLILSGPDRLIVWRRQIWRIWRGAVVHPIEAAKTFCEVPNLYEVSHYCGGIQYHSIKYHETDIIIFGLISALEVIWDGSSLFLTRSLDLKIIVGSSFLVASNDSLQKLIISLRSVRTRGTHVF